MSRRLPPPALLVVFAWIAAGPARSAPVPPVLQAFSFLVPSANPTPDVSNGLLYFSAGATNNQEWKDAYVRAMQFVDSAGNPVGGGGTKGWILFEDQQAWLYVGVAVPAPNNSNGSYCAVYLDENASLAGTGAIPGAGGNLGGYYARVTTQGGGALLQDGGWNGSGWVNNATLGVATPYFTGWVQDAGTGGNHLFEYEFRIPLSRSNVAYQGGSGCLNVGSPASLGIQVVFYSSGANTSFYWGDTNRNETNPASGSGWGLVQTGIPLPTRQLGAPVALSTPVLTGANTRPANPVSQDPAWSSWTTSVRSITLLNYQSGSTIPAVLYLTEDGAGAIGGGTGELYVGLQVLTAQRSPTPQTAPNAGDYCVVYQEDAFAASLTGSPNWVLEPALENACRAEYTGGSTTLEMSFTNNTGAAPEPNWQQDSPFSTPPSAGSAFWQTGGGGNRYEFAYRLPYNHLWTSGMRIYSGQKLNFLIRYHDAANNLDFYSTDTVNATAELLNVGSVVNYSIAWYLLQTAAPATQFVYPEQGFTVEGTYPVCVFAAASGGQTISGVTLQVTGPGGYNLGPFALQGNSPTNFWTWNWNTLPLANGAYTLTAQAISSSGAISTASINVAVANQNVPPPCVSILSPTPSPTAIVSGTTTVSGQAFVAAGINLTSIELAVDGGPWQNVTGITAAGQVVGACGTSGATYNVSNWTFPWNTAAVLDGSHLLLARVTTSASQSAVSALVLVTVDNSNPLVFVTAPAAGSFLRGPGLSFSASAANWTVSGVTAQFYLNATGIGAGTPAGNGTYALAGWNSTSVPDGSYALTASATDLAGLSATSPPIPVAVDNAAPVVGAFAAMPVPDGGFAPARAYAREIQLSIPVGDVTSGVDRVALAQRKPGSSAPLRDASLAPVNGRVTIELVLADGPNEIQATAYDRAGNSAGATWTIEYRDPRVTARVGSGGGTLASLDGSSLVLPAGGLARETEIWMVPARRAEVPAFTDPSVRLVGAAHRIGPLRLVFGKPATLTLRLNPSELDPDRDGTDDFSVGALVVWSHDGAAWRRIGRLSSDSLLRTVTAEVNHTGLFVLATDAAETGGPAVYVTANPFRSGDGTGFVFALESASSVTIAVHDLSGDLVRTLVAGARFGSGRGSVRWDGRTRSGAVVPPGTYFWTFEANGDDGTSVSKRGAIGVTR